MSGHALPLLHLLAPGPLSLAPWPVITALLALALLAASHRWGRVLSDARREAADLRRRLAAAEADVGELRRRGEGQEKLTSLGMLAAGVAHEINNPMSYVTSNLEGLAGALRSCPHLPAALREYADEVLPDTLDGVQRVNAIVADLRSFARSDAGPMEDFDLNAQVATALRIAAGHLRGRIQLATSFGKLPAAYGRPQQLTQVLVNLLVNAAQAIPERGAVAVTTRCDPDELLVEVRDSGVGMDQATLARLFQPFFTTKPVGVGTGLGLAVAHGIVRRHGGRIGVRSQPGVGSTFTVHLPRARPSSARALARPTRAREAVALSV